MTTLNLNVVTREEIKADIAEAIMNGDIVAAKVRFIILDEIITEQGFESAEEISEYYQIKHFVDASYKGVLV
jgi:hypothetical protein